MALHKFLRSVALVGAFWAGGTFLATQAGPLAKAEALMQKAIEPAVSDEFASKEEAETFLAKALPMATAGNPKYRGADGALTQWLTKRVAFGPGSSATGISVEMNEDIFEFRNNLQSATGTHDVKFLIEDVQISELTDGTELTEAGDKALGIIFRCNSGKCIEAKWNGAPAPSDWSDISIQDRDVRMKILAAFQALKRFAGDRKA